MVVGLYCIYDRVAMEAGPVYQAKTDGVAIRGFHKLLESDKVNPNDFRLYKVGTFDDESMLVGNDSCPREVFSPGDKEVV